MRELYVPKRVNAMVVRSNIVPPDRLYIATTYPDLDRL